MEDKAKKKNNKGIELVSKVHNMKTLKRTYTIKQSAKRAAALHQAKIKEVREVISENKQDSSRIKMRKTPAGVFL
ncbi:hypothetical protein [Herbaspirillum huttiense]|uniref:Uncharacterized protein n=2 Tax=Herbaspirillum huttiense TaxID=863372 RepID=A0AAJ2H6X6_9BURK|nr:hypothetical protein [Herbaspirillum huttiense]MDR9834986.1 hypothetical protein [Herbaspirillum huttiense]